MVEIIMPDGTFLSSIIASGAGDFMADGSVPMTGNLLIDKASPVIELDTSATSSFLKLSQATVLKGQIWTSNNYLMVKSMTDDLQLISASSAGKKIDFITNDVTRFRIEDAAATLAISLAMGSNKITGLATPTTDYDGATKKYVDDNIGAGGDFMADGSVSMTGDLSIDKATPVIELDTSATSSMIKFLQATVLKGQIWTSNNYFMMKSYAGDLQIVGPSSVGMNIDFITNDVTRFRIEDSTLTAVVPLAMSSYKITGLAAPTTDYDGATKKYVDDNVGGAGDFMADGSVPMTGNLSIDKASPVIELDTSATSSFLKLSQASTVRGQLWASNTILMLKSMTGDLQLISASSAGKKIDFITNDVTRFRIEDAAATLAVSLAMGSNKITGLGTPTTSTDATTKGYADALPGTNAATFKINQDNVGTEASALEFDRGSAATAARIHWSEINDRFTFESVKTSTLAEVRTLQLDVQDQINLDDTTGTVKIKKNDSTGDMEFSVAAGDSFVFKTV